MPIQYVYDIETEWYYYDDRRKLQCNFRWSCAEKIVLLKILKNLFEWC